VEKDVIAKNIGNGFKKRFKNPFIRLLEKPFIFILGIKAVDKIYFNASILEEENNFPAKVLHSKVMNVKINVSQSEILNIPSTGSLIVVSNHPFGGVDGMAMLKLIKQIRPDVKLLSNYILADLKMLENDFFLVDPFESSNSSKNSYAGIKKTIAWLKDGHVISLFPSGEVSSYNKKEKKVTDIEWKETIGSIIKKMEIPVVCFHFKGRNSYLFHILGYIHPSLRTLRLAREFTRQCNTTITVKISKPIFPKEIKKYSDVQELMAFLKARTYET